MRQHCLNQSILALVLIEKCLYLLVCYYLSLFSAGWMCSDWAVGQRWSSSSSSSSSSACSSSSLGIVLFFVTRLTIIDDLPQTGFNLPPNVILLQLIATKTSQQMSWFRSKVFNRSTRFYFLSVFFSLFVFYIPFLLSSLPFIWIFLIFTEIVCIVFFVYSAALSLSSLKLGKNKQFPLIVSVHLLFLRTPPPSPPQIWNLTHTQKKWDDRQINRKFLEDDFPSLSTVA